MKGVGDVSDTGWIKLHRQLLDSRVFSDDKALKVWIWCLLKANHKGRFYRGIDVFPGQFITGQVVASQELRMSQSVYRRTIKKLKEWGQVDTKPTNQYTTVTICHWEIYQDAEQADRPTDDQRMANQRPTDGQRMNIQRPTDEHPATTNKKVKTAENVKNDENEKNDKNSRGQKKSFSIGDIDFPDWSNDATRNAMTEWLDHKRQKRSPYKTKSGIEKLLKRFTNPADFCDAVDFSISNNYQGLIEPKRSDNKPGIFDSLQRFGERHGVLPDVDVIATEAKRIQ